VIPVEKRFSYLLYLLLTTFQLEVSIVMELPEGEEKSLTIGLCAPDSEFLFIKMGTLKFYD